MERSRASTYTRAGARQRTGPTFGHSCDTAHTAMGSWTIPEPYLRYPKAEGGSVQSDFQQQLRYCSDRFGLSDESSVLGATRTS